MISSSSSSPSPVSYSITVANQQHLHAPSVTVNSPMNYFNPGVLSSNSNGASARTHAPPVVSVPNSFPTFAGQSLATNGTLNLPSGHPINQLNMRQQHHQQPQPAHSMQPQIPLHSSQNCLPNPPQKPAQPMPAIVRPVPELAKSDICGVRRANKWLVSVATQTLLAVVSLFRNGLFIFVCFRLKCFREIADGRWPLL